MIILFISPVFFPSSSAFLATRSSRMHAAADATTALLRSYYKYVYSLRIEIFFVLFFSYNIFGGGVHVYIFLQTSLCTFRNDIIYNILLLLYKSAVLFVLPTNPPPHHPTVGRTGDINNYTGRRLPRTFRLLFAHAILRIYNVRARVCVVYLRVRVCVCVCYPYRKYVYIYTYVCVYAKRKETRVFADRTETGGTRERWCGVANTRKYKRPGTETT